MSITESYLRAMSGWKVDAADEDISTLFFPFRGFERLNSNDAYFVVGRKGSGKTAAALKIQADPSFSGRTYRLSFQDIPINELYSQNDDGFSSSSSLMPFWLFTIYSTICFALSSSKELSIIDRMNLRRAFQSDPASALKRGIAPAKDYAATLSILGVEGSLSSSKPSSENLSWRDAATSLERYLVNRKWNCPISIVFDELDSDYGPLSTSGASEKYNTAIVSLVKSILQVKRILANRGVHIMALFRDDIFDTIKDPEKNKWNDRIVRLSWTPESIDQLINWRIMSSKISHEDVNYRKLFKDTIYIPYSRKSQISPADHMKNVSMLRPRDFIYYLRAGAEKAIQQGHEIIDTVDVLHADKMYSRYLLQELKDEIFPVIPDIDEVLSIITRIGTRRLIIEEFIEELKKENISLIDKYGDRYIIEILFYFSIVGIELREGSWDMAFRFEDPSMRYAGQTYVLLHPGLWKALYLNKNPLLPNQRAQKLGLSNPRKN